LGIHQQTLKLREQRSELLAGNIANADTPNYKARDVKFEQMLQDSVGTQKGHKLNTTQAGHIATPDNAMGKPQVMYRVPTQPSLDGNTVETHIEQAAFGENAIKYQASLRFLDGRFKGLLSAIRGE
jgi:flagellar basal-body rod protein FlgB